MKITKHAMIAAGLLAAVAAAPASAGIYEYTMTNGDVLTINSDSSSATFTGSTINTSMTSASFASFTGGATPTFSFILDSLDGTRLIGGNWITDNPLNSTTTHPQKLIAYGPSQSNKVNLWAWWGDPIIGGDYITYIKSYSAKVPEPGALGLMGLGLMGLAFARRRKKFVAA
ncbi:MAG: PEP-CTERM sorting domain-containing protein [Pontixanthobacter sp.]